MNFIIVALGGALGALGRYSISLIPVKTTFPLLTFITNLLGAILIGFIVGLTDKKENVSPETVLFWKTGVCGGFTTFSTFSLEAYNLFEKNSYPLGCLYIFLSVCGCILGILLGKKLSTVIS